MYFIDELTGKETCHPKPKRVLVQIVDGIYVYGYTKNDSACVSVRSKQGAMANVLIGSPLMDNLLYSNRQGCYLFKEGMSRREIIQETYIKGRNNGPGGGHNFPYHSFNRRYEAIDNFEIFKNRQEIQITEKEYPVANYMRYSFGLEFETSEGYIPEHLCFRDGLIPLRDGSITGLEYSTIVMQGKEGLRILDQQLQTLRKYTNFDKECSLHIHFGGYPLNTDAIYNLYRICKGLEVEIQRMVPALTFRTAEYKASGKDYCKLLPPNDHNRLEDSERVYKNFKDLYTGLTGKSYEGSLTQPHPNDPGRERKWQINTRYFWVNFINMICYDVNKTVEFRLLRPCYNLEKITFWLYTFNAILTYSERLGEKPNFSNITLEKIYRDIYGDELAETLLDEKAKLEILVQDQHNHGDNIGGTIHIEDSIFDKELSL